MKNRTLLTIATITGLASPLIAQFALVEDFETGFTVGNSVVGVNGWNADTPAGHLAAADPASSGRGMVARAMGSAQEILYKNLPVGAHIANNTTGTLFFEIYFPTNNIGEADVNLGLSDQTIPDGYPSYEAHLRFSQTDIEVRANGTFPNSSYDFESGVWMKVWMVADNSNNTVDVYIKSPSGQSGQVQIANNFGFRNGTTSPLESFLLIQNSQQDIYFDNIHLDTGAENLGDPTSSLTDTDTDEMDDSWEVQHFGDISRDGTLDFDSDGLSDLEEFLASTDPTNDDSDGDGFPDGAEVAAQSDPNDINSVPGGFARIEDFEGSGMTIGETFDEVNGWDADVPNRSLVEGDPAGGFRGQVGRLIAGSRNDVFKTLGGNSITNSTNGTLFFEAYVPVGTAGTNWNIGLSDQGNPDNFSAFEAQFRIENGLISPRNGGNFTSTGYEVNAGEWIQVWMDADNTTDTVDIYVKSPNGESEQIQVADNFSFRNGTGSFLETFLTIQSGSVDIFIDNIYLDKSGTNLELPPIPGFEPKAINDSIEVGIGGAIRFSPLSNDTGNIEASTLALITPPSQGTVELKADSGEIVYRHSGTSSGIDSFRYRISNPGETISSEADVAVTLSSELRLASSTVNVPLAPPTASTGSLVLENALPGLTFNTAVAMASVPGSPKALIVASINGSVWYVPDTTATNPTKHEILNVASLSNFTRGRSIYSIECYPDFATSGNVIINYQGDSSRLPMAGGEFDTSVITGLDKNGAPDFNIECDLRVSRFTLSAAHIADAVANGMSAAENELALDTEFPFLNIAEQHLFHSINDAKFGPDGYLYVSFGDEGDQGSPYRNEQKLTKDQYGSIIRIDVDPASTNPFPSAHYGIAVGPLVGSSPTTRTHDFFTDPSSQIPNFRVPAANPFLHDSKGGTSGWDGSYNEVSLLSQLDLVRSEIWAFGLRNPFKFHLDIEDGTGEIEAWIGDVGKDAREEFTVLKKGENGGWAYWEGSIVTPGLAYSPLQPSGTTPHKEPIFDYPHGTNGNSATGGIFYRDNELAALTNKYICADYGSGRVWSIERDGTVEELTNLRLGGAVVVDFNLDMETKDILVLEHSSNGRVMRITNQDGQATEDYPPTLTATGIFADLTDLSPNPGVIPYSPNLTFWSDGADKKRWFAINNLTDTIGYSENESWSLPEGMVTVKHFDYDLDQQNPGSNVKRLETRLIMRNEEGAYGVSYRWNEDGTEAHLVANQGEDFAISFTNEVGAIENFDWHIPSRAECMTCHTQTAGFGLSLNTRQFNRDYTINGHSGNQLTLLSDAGYLSGLNQIPDNLPRHYRPSEIAEDLEARVRSYLAVNCAYCHQPDGGTPPSWDGRTHLSLEETNLLYGTPESEGTPDLSDDIIRPGDKLNSSIWNKINARTAINGDFNGYSQMPPLASNRFDDEGIALIQEWIDHHANTPPTGTTPTNLTIQENSIIGTTAGVAQSTDLDVRNGVTDQSQLSYAITGGNAQGYFEINSTTGEITVTGWLDYEKASTHVVEVTASDNFSPNPQKTVSTVTLTVQDVPSEDANENGLPDSWENFFSLANAGLDTDTDGDSVSEFFEFLSGGNPTSALSPTEPVVAVLAAEGQAGQTFTWRFVNGLELGEDYLVQGSSLLSGWTNLEPGVDFEVVTDNQEGPGYRRITMRLLSPQPNYFIRLSSP